MLCHRYRRGMRSRLRRMQNRPARLPYSSYRAPQAQPMDLCQIETPAVTEVAHLMLPALQRVLATLVRLRDARARHAGAASGAVRD